MSAKWIWSVKANDERRKAWRSVQIKTAAQAGQLLSEVEEELTKRSDELLKGLDWDSWGKILAYVSEDTEEPKEEILQRVLEELKAIVELRETGETK